MGGRRRRAAVRAAVRARFFPLVPLSRGFRRPRALGADMPAMRRSRSSRDMVVAETDWGGAAGALAAAPPMPRRPLSASASFAAPGTPTPGTPTPVSGTLPTMAPGIGFLPSARRFPAAAPAPLPRPIAPANPLLPATGIFGPAGGACAAAGGAPARPGRSAAAIASTPLPPPLPSFPSQPPLVIFPFLSATTRSGAALPSCGIAGGWLRLTSCAVGSIAPRRSGRTP